MALLPRPYKEFKGYVEKSHIQPSATSQSQEVSLPWSSLQVRVSGSRFRVQGLGSRVQGLGFKVEGLKLRV